MTTKPTLAALLDDCCAHYNSLEASAVSLRYGGC